MGKHVSAPLQRAGWFKSSRSNGKAGCVEVKFDGNLVLIRDSKYLRNPNNDPALQPIMPVSALKWKEFLEKVVGQTVSASVDLPEIERDETGGATLRLAGVALVYNRMEWDAFVEGILAEEFASV